MKSKLFPAGKSGSAIYGPIATRNLRRFPKEAPLNGGWEQGAFLEMVLRQVPGAIVVCDMQGKITLANAAARHLAEMEPEGRSLDSVTEIWGEMLDGRGAPVPAHQWPCLQALRGKTTIGKQCRLVRSDGDSYDLSFSAAPIRSTVGHIVGVVATLTDMTQWNRAAALRRQEAVESERSRMAADLHDTMAQGLNAIVLQLQVADEEFAENSDQARRRFRRAQDVAREILAYARSSMWTLCDEFGQSESQVEDLAPALSFLAHQLFAATPIKLKCSLQQQICALAPQMRLDLLRICREALANVLKHARATSVHIQLLYKHGHVQLSVDDNGRGFVGAPSSNLHRSFGLSSMRERARRLGGKVTVKSQPGRGTRVTALVPLAPDFRQRASA